MISDNLTVLDHPLVVHKLTLMREKTTETAKFRKLLREISLLVLYEVLRDLKLHEIEIETQIGTYALHMHKAFNHNSNCRIAGEMSGSRWAFDHCLTLPLYHNMTDEDQYYVVSELLKCLS